MARPLAERGSLAVLTLLSVLLFAVPLVLLARLGFAPDDRLTLNPLIEAVQSAPVRRALWHSLESGLLSAAIATVLGAVLALVVGLTDLRGKRWLIFLVLLPMMIPPHVTAIAWIQMLGPASTILKSLGIAPPPGSTHPLYSRQGVIALLALQHMPLVFLTARAALRALPRDLGDAARVSGARPARVLGRIILPLMLPALIAGFALAFVSALGNFAIPALLGTPARYTTLPVLMWQRLASFGPGVLGEMAVLAALIAVVALVAVAAQMALVVRLGARLTGPPQAPMLLRLGAARWAVEAAIWSLVLALVVLPFAAMLTTALSPTYGVALTRETVTLRHFAEVLFTQQVTARALFNSTILAGGAAVLIAAGAVLLGYFFARPAGAVRRIARGTAYLAEISYAVPGLVISVAFIIAFIRPLPLIGVSIYGTLWIILFAYLAAFFAIALKPVGVAYGQLDPALDDAARVSGASWGFRMRRIHLPLVMPAAASGAILVFLTAYNEVTVSAILWSQGTETIGTVIFNYEDGGYTTLASALSVVTVLATTLLMLGLDRMARHLPPGAIPWRD